MACLPCTLEAVSRYPVTEESLRLTIRGMATICARVFARLSGLATGLGTMGTGDSSVLALSGLVARLVAVMCSD